jgi:class 3 adenylate cyclase/tetratricopeptide (TPR) repeat protein
MRRGSATGGDGTARLRPYLPRITVDWYRDEPQVRHRIVDGSLVFVDVSGFTKLSERLARRGRIGAEQLTESLSSVFTELLASAYSEGGSLLKFGGDALLLLFTGDGHAVHACRAANGMRAELRRVGIVETGGAPVVLRMSAGVHSGRFAFFLVGDTHRELLLTGPDVTTTVRMEGAANAGQVMVSPATAALLPSGVLARTDGPGSLLRKVDVPGDVAAPAVTSEPLPHDVDISPCVSASLRDHLLAGGDEAEHRTLTVAFIHFDGTDHLLADGGPEAVEAALDELVSTVQHACAEFGVTFLATDLDADGGKIILLGGAPRATGNDEEAMLRALRQVLDTPKRLPVRIGVNRGHVFVGDVGPRYRRTYTVMGDTVNVAARLMAAAAPGTMLTTEGVLERSATQFQTETLEPLSLKGKSQKVQAYAVGAPTGARRADSGELALVGRATEVTVLLDAVASARAGRGAVVELVGDAGIGKSRLARECVTSADDFAIAWVTCEPYGTSSPYETSRALLADALHLDLDLDNLGDHLHKLVARDAPELLPWMPLLGTAFGLDLDDTPETAALEPQFRRERVAEKAAELLRCSLAGPKVLVVDDAHWIDDASRDVVRRIGTTAADEPWLVCITTRAVAVPSCAPDDAVRRLALQPLPEAEAARLVDAATEHSPLLPSVVHTIAERAGGNPMFLEELARATASGLADAPDSVSAVITAQLDRLPPPRRRLLRTASVLGRRFESALLEAVLDSPLPGPRSAVWSELRDFVQWDGDEHLRFRQSLVRDAAYDRLTYRERRALHGRAGEALLERAAGEVDAHAALLSLHFIEAHRFGDAWHYANVGGAHAEATYANNEAAELYERALSAARYVPELDDADLARTWTALGDVRERAGNYSAASRAWRAARRLHAPRPVARAALMLKEAWLAERVARLSEGVRWVRRGQRCLEEVDTPEAARQRAQLAAFYAMLRQAQGQYAKAVRAAKLAIEEATACDERDALALAYLALDWAYVEWGRPEHAVFSREALRLYEELGDLGHQAMALNNLGGLAYWAGRWREALDLYEQGRAVRGRTGDEIEAARGTVNIGEILGDQGRLEPAEATLLEGRRVWQAAGYRAGTGYVTMLLARVAARAGRFDDAHARFDEARAEMTAIGAEGELLIADAYHAECLALEGRTEAAAEAVAETSARADRSGMQMLAPLLRRVDAIVAAQRGDAAEARRRLAASIAVAKSLEADHELGLTLDVEVQLDLAEGRDASEAIATRDEIFARLDVAQTPRIRLTGSR